jgi:acetolactate synthase-1/2/3 large subunit
VSDGSLSLIRIKQERKAYARYGTTLRRDSDDYRSGSSFFGVPVIAATSREEYKRALTEAFEAEGPVVIEAFVETGGYDSLVLRGNR